MNKLEIGGKAVQWFGHLPWDPEIPESSDHSLNFILVMNPKFKCPAAVVNSKLVCLRPVGILKGTVLL